MSQPLCSVIIPAHNEEAVIARTLRKLLRTSYINEFEVIVVCNGCEDRTSEVVHGEFPSVRLIELDTASKTTALNAGLAAATGKCVLLLDADIELSTRAARSLLDALQPPRIIAAIGRMEVDLEGASFWVRCFYRIWLLHPYLENGKFAAAIALSRAALGLIGEIPEVTADDTYLRRRVAPDRVATADAVFTVRVPRTISSLIRVRTRSYRGTSQLGSHAAISVTERYQEAFELARKILRRPGLWPRLPVYLLVNVAALVAARRAVTHWERDLTTRTGVPEAS